MDTSSCSAWAPHTHPARQWVDRPGTRQGDKPPTPSGDTHHCHPRTCHGASRAPEARTTVGSSGARAVVGQSLRLPPWAGQGLRTAPGPVTAL